MFGSNPFLNAMQPPTDTEEEVEDDGGVALPLGFTQNAIDFSESPRVEEIRAKQAKSVLYTPLMASITKCISLFFFASPFMAVNNLFALISAAIASLSNAFSLKSRLTPDARLVAVAIGLGLALFAVWRASAIGLLGSLPESQKPDTYVPLLVAPV